MPPAPPPAPPRGLVLPRTPVEQAAFERQERLDRQVKWILRIAAVVVPLLVLAAVLAYASWPDPAFVYTPGSLVKFIPTQRNLSGGRAWDYKGCAVTPLAEYRATGIVLSKLLYTRDEPALISPFDVGLGWGAMSDPEVLKDIECSQDHRFLKVGFRRLPDIDWFSLRSQLSNIHTIPASEAVRAKLEGLPSGQIATLTGKLVRVEFPGGGLWESSLRRGDTDDGACEIMWVEAVEATPVEAWRARAPGS